MTMPPQCRGPLSLTAGAQGQAGSRQLTSHACHSHPQCLSRSLTDLGRCHWASVTFHFGDRKGRALVQNSSQDAGRVAPLECLPPLHLPGRTPGGRLFGDFSRIGGLMFLEVPHPSTGSCIQDTCLPFLPANDFPCQRTCDDIQAPGHGRAPLSFPTFPTVYSKSLPLSPAALLALGSRLCWVNSSNQTYGPATE